MDKKRSTSTTSSGTTTTTKFRNRRFLTLNISETILDIGLKFYMLGNTTNKFPQTKFQVATTSATSFYRPLKMSIFAHFLTLYVMGLASIAPLAEM